MFTLAAAPPSRGCRLFFRTGTLHPRALYAISNICNIVEKRGPNVKLSLEKQKRLVYAARRYYLEDQKQSDIARELGISRPMVSRLLAEAREFGVVEIKIHDPERQSDALLEQLRSAGLIQGGVLVEDGADNDETNQRLSQGAVALLGEIGARRLGVGWGYLIGQLVTWLEQHPQPHSAITDICPLVGNASIPARNYQSNENVRLMAQLLHRDLPPDLPAVGTDRHGSGEHRRLPLQPGFCLPGPVWEPAPGPAGLRPNADLLLQRGGHCHSVRPGFRHPDPH